MPLPQSSHRPAAIDVTYSFGAAQSSQEPCVPVPALPRLSISTPSRTPNGLPYPMTDNYSELMPLDEQSHLPVDFVGMDDPTAAAMQWPIQYDFPNLPHASTHEGAPNGYSMSSQYNAESSAMANTTSFRITPNDVSLDTDYLFAYPPVEDYRNCPRSFAHGIALDGSYGSIGITESYPPSAYVIDPPRQHDTADNSDQNPSPPLLQQLKDYEAHGVVNLKREDSVEYASPYNSLSNSRCSTPQEHYRLPRRDHAGGTTGDEGPIDKDQPYAQLIYRALMGAPDRTMILRDIYAWFVENTDKAADKETKGWQNSIRHNLSMNGAFEKVDHPSEEAKKGFMWRLTDEAIREGVKSTTRYRSKVPNKRSHRVAHHHPQPLRQASGAKGGQAARRAARIRRAQRFTDAFPARSDPYTPRVIPTSYPIHDQQMYNGAEPHCPQSPYYASDLEFDAPSTHGGEFGSSPSTLSAYDFTGFISTHNQNHNHNLNHNLNQNNLSSHHGLLRGGDTAFVLPQDSSSDSLFYGTGTDDSPSPTVSEPLTPDSAGDLSLDFGFGEQGVYVYDDLGSSSSSFHDGA